MASSRIGIGDGGSEKLWRFFLDGNPHVSIPGKPVRETILPLADAKAAGFACHA
jgi:hypothetical protein